MNLLERLRRLAESARRVRGDEPGGGESFDEGVDEIDPFDPFPEPVVLEITDVFDLHTVPPREVKRVVEAYLEEARRAGFRSVRIIHGKGRGVQRETVRAVLSRTPFVVTFTDAPPAAGGWGATVAHLERSDEG
ncbi:MAG: Smr/MutS family protein [Acidobacteria bacterium]|nr:Smr/MutS family protein [Acidobacteriota bacterium]